MERAAALKKIGKILGKNMGYEVDPKAPDAEEREVAQAELAVASARRKAITEKMDARRSEILQADPEFQRLKAAYSEARKHCDELSYRARGYRFTVGISNALFFHVKAQGDSWEEVIEKLKKEVAR